MNSHKMTTLEKILASLGIALLASAAGYCAYKFIKAREEDSSKPEDDEEEEGDWESASSDDEPKVPLTTLMDFVIIESVEILTQYIYPIQDLKMNNRDNADAVIARVQDEMERRIGEIEEKMCKENGWDAEEYANEIVAKREAGDPEVTHRINTIHGILQNIGEGQKPNVSFTLDPVLTPERTIRLYRWILSSHIYLFYKEVHKRMDEGMVPTQNMMLEMFKELEVTKENRRYFTIIT